MKFSIKNGEAVIDLHFKLPRKDWVESDYNQKFSRLNQPEVQRPEPLWAVVKWLRQRMMETEPGG